MLKLSLVLLCLTSTYVLAESPVIKIGVVQSLTGIAAEDGTTVVQALRLAAEDLRKEGTSVELVIEDDQSVPRHSTAAARKLMSSGVDAIIAATWDFTTNPVLPLAAQNKTVVFNTSIFPESLDLEATNGFGYTNATTLEVEAEPFRRWLRTTSPRSIVLVYANNSWGEAQREVYSRISRELGVEILDELKPASFDANEWGSLALRIKSKKPKAIALLLNKNDIVSFQRRATEIGLHPVVFASANAYDAYRLSNSGAALTGICFTYPLERLQKAAEFSRDYTRKFGSAPRVYADNTYDALRILVRGHEIARQNSIPLQQALLKVNYHGLAGSYRFDPHNSFSIGQASLVCIKEQGLEILSQ